MKLYQTPGGTWAGSEKDWKAAMKAEGSDPKAVERKIVEVPTDKPGLMEFLTFHNVNVISPGAAPQAEAVGGASQPPIPETPPAAPPPPTVPRLVESVALDEAFMAAPLGQQLTLAQLALEEAFKRIH